jgi:hypothetical protein
VATPETASQPSWIPHAVWVCPLVTGYTRDRNGVAKTDKKKRKEEKKERRKEEKKRKSLFPKTKKRRHKNGLMDSRGNQADEKRQNGSYTTI